MASDGLLEFFPPLRERGHLGARLWSHGRKMVKGRVLRGRLSTRFEHDLKILTRYSMCHIFLSQCLVYWKRIGDIVSVGWQRSGLDRYSCHPTRKWFSFWMGKQGSVPSDPCFSQGLSGGAISLCVMFHKGVVVSGNCCSPFLGCHFVRLSS